MNQATFNIAVMQSACTADPQANLQKTMEQIRAAAARGAQVICTQELFRTLYFCQSENPANFEHAEAVPGPTSEIFGQLARELGVVIVASLFERRAAGVYHNTTAVLDADGTFLGAYRKMHIPDDPLYYEKYYFTPGDGPVVPASSSAASQSSGPFRTFATRFGRIGVLICWDQWYPEAARLTALQDCAVIFYPTAIGWHPREKATLGPAQLSAWETIQRAHAIANGVYVAAANRTGFEKIPDTPGDGIEFWGNSFISDPFGRVLQKAAADKEEILVATVDPKVQEETRQLWPFLRDRRVDAYGELTTRWGH
jgi:N-carbamoylputrescine amidase